MMITTRQQQLHDALNGDVVPAGVNERGITRVTLSPIWLQANWISKTLTHRVEAQEFMNEGAGRWGVADMARLCCPKRGNVGMGSSSPIGQCPLHGLAPPPPTPLLSLTAVFARAPPPPPPKKQPTTTQLPPAATLRPSPHSILDHRGS